MELKGTNKIENSQWNTYVKARVQCILQRFIISELYQYNPWVGGNEPMSKPGWIGPMMVPYMHYHKNFQTLSSINKQQIWPFIAKNMIHRGQYVGAEVWMSEWSCNPAGKLCAVVDP